MSLLIACTSCGAQFKAPEKAAGRTVKCLKCNAKIAVPAAAPLAKAPALVTTLPSAEPAILGTLPVAEALVGAESSSAGPSERQAALLTALFITGAAAAFILVIALLVIVLTRSGRPGNSVLIGPQPGEYKRMEAGS